MKMIDGCEVEEEGGISEHDEVALACVTPEYMRLVHEHGPFRRVRMRMLCMCGWGRRLRLGRGLDDGGEPGGFRQRGGVTLRAA